MLCANNNISTIENYKYDFSLSFNNIIQKLYNEIARILFFFRETERSKRILSYLGSFRRYLSSAQEFGEIYLRLKIASC